MDGQAMIRTYGNTKLLDGAPDRPLITFALFAYNQEKYIRKAVEGAFSQTYSPLEIILSDDCSSDRTFEIMKEMAREYDGPHLVRVVKTDRNLGVTNHVLLRGAQAMGEIVVGAAGDDISKPERCAEHIPYYDDPNVMAVTGAYDLIDEEGNIIASEVKGPIKKQSFRKQRSLFKKTKFPYVVIQGSTASYRKDVFSFPVPPWKFLFSEDNLLNLTIYAYGYKVETIPVSLVMYRRHYSALSNRPVAPRTTLQDVETEIINGAIKDIQLVRFVERLGKELGDDSIINQAGIARRIRRGETLRGWSNYSFTSRLKSLVYSIIIADLEMAKCKFFRLFGRFPVYQPKGFTFKFRGR